MPSAGIIGNTGIIRFIPGRALYEEIRYLVSSPTRTKNLEWYLQEHGAIVTRDKLITIAKIESASLNRPWPCLALPYLASTALIPLHVM